MGTDSSKNRKGTLAGLDIYLAPYRERPYIRRYVDVLPDRQDIPGDPGKVNADTDLRRWHINDWSGGAGADLWDPESGVYRRDEEAMPAINPDVGVTTSLLRTTALDDLAATFAEHKRFGKGLGKLWAVADTTGHEWDPDNDEWVSTGITTGAGASAVTSIADGHDTFMYSAHETGAIWRWKSGSNTDHVDAAVFTETPVIVDFEGVLYALDGDDLYTIDKTVADTRTQVSDSSPASSAVYLATTPQCYHRLATSDVGPIWLQYTDNGQVFIHEYNQFTDTHQKVGKLPVDFAFPYSIFFTQGFIFVGFRYAAKHSHEGDPYLYFQRGSQRGVIPFPQKIKNASYASKPVFVGGVIGDELIASDGDAGIVRYSLSTGGMYRASETNPDTDLTTFGKTIFSGHASDNVIWSRPGVYSTDGDTASVGMMVGRYDFGYPGIKKILFDVTVTAKPLPANTSVRLFYSVDADSNWTLHPDTWDTDGETSHTFAVSTSSGSATGQDFALRILPLSSVSSATPEILSVTARATSAEKHIEWFLELDCGDRQDAAGNANDSADLIADLVSAADNDGIVAFVDAWSDEEHEGTTSYDVRVIDVQLPDQSEQAQYALVRLRQVGVT